MGGSEALPAKTWLEPVRDREFERWARRELPRAARFAIVVNGIDDRSRGAADELVGLLTQQEPSLTVVAIRRSPAGPNTTLG